MSDFSPRGEHVLADVSGLAPQCLADPVQIEAWLRQAATLAGAQVLAGHFHHFGAHGGVTGVLLLAQSHLSIHTWPEAGYAAVDAFMCGQARAARAIDALIDAMRAEGGAPVVRRHALTRSV